MVYASLLSLTNYTHFHAPQRQIREREEERARGNRRRLAEEKAALEKVSNKSKIDVNLAVALSQRKAKTRTFM